MNSNHQAAFLAKEEEQELARRAGAGDDAAVERLVTSHFNYVVKIARGYRRSGVPMADLVQEGMVWAFNGVAGMPDEPLAQIDLGRTVRLRMVNDTAWPHAMHLHGHHFQTVTAGRASGPMRDTLLVARGETAEVTFVADNPGDWLLHCHMVEHTAAGMMTWLRVE